jgi:hypothetical protein
MVDVLEHKFASSLSGDTGDVDFDFGHVETLFHPPIIVWLCSQR